MKHKKIVKEVRCHTFTFTEEEMAELASFFIDIDDEHIHLMNPTTLKFFNLIGIRNSK